MTQPDAVTTPPMELLPPLTENTLPDQLALMSRTEFSDLSLHDKNAYLQNLAADFCSLTGRPAQPLDKDALSRLRRYYSRRVFADLKLDQAPDSDLNRALRALGEAIRAKDLCLEYLI